MPPISNISPFSYRDGATYLEILYALRDYVNITLRPEFDTEMQALADQFQAGISNAEAEITAQEADWTTRFNAYMVDVNASLQALNDTAMGGLINTPGSATATALAALYGDTALAEEVNTPASALRAALDALYTGKAYVDSSVAAATTANTAATATAIDTALASRSIVSAGNVLAGDPAMAFRDLGNNNQALDLTMPAANYGYLVTGFTGNGVTNEKLSVFYSPDGKTVFGRGGKMVYQDQSTGLSVRDPSTLQIGSTWYTAYTVNNGYTKNFGIAKSTDLTNWTLVGYVDVSSIAGLNQAWAPELVTDDNGDVYAFFTSQSSGNSGSPYRVKAMSADLSSWSAPAPMLWTATPGNMIDPCFIKNAGTWYCFYRNVTTGYIERATAATLTGTWTTDKTGDWAGWGTGVEAPEIIKTGTGVFRIYLDRFAGTGYGWSESADLATGWTALATVKAAPGVLAASQLFRHGSFIRLRDQQSASTAMAAALNSGPLHAEFTASRAVAANVGEGPGTLVLDPANSTANVGNFVSIPAMHQIEFMVDGYYSVNWVGNHAGTAAGTGAYMALRGPAGSLTFASVDLEPTSGLASVAMPPKYFTAGTILQFACQFGNVPAQGLGSTITVHKHH